MKVYSLVLCAIVVLIGSQVDCVAGSPECQKEYDPCVIIRCCPGMICSSGSCRYTPAEDQRRAKESLDRLVKGVQEYQNRQQQG